MTITTKRYPFRFYTSIAFASLFFLVVGTLLLFVCVDIFRNGNLATKDCFMPVFIFLLYLLAFTLPYIYWKNCPQITINRHSIRIGKEVFYLEDISEIVLTGKIPFKFIIDFPMEGSVIIFSNGTRKFIFDDLYSNISEVKLFLEHVVLKKKEFDIDSTPIVEISKSSIHLENEEIFKGNQFTSFRGIALWGLIGFMVFLVMTKEKVPPMGFFTIGVIGVFWFVMQSLLMHYFGLANGYLVVRNHVFIWKTRIYRLADIKEVVYEKQGKQPNSMRIITNDFRNKLYPAGTLRDNTWMKMKRQLEFNGVSVRNECVDEE